MPVDLAHRYHSFLCVPGRYLQVTDGDRRRITRQVRTSLPLLSHHELIH